MNIRKKIREFFTLTQRASGGFTLVELIVVIAILAILAGIAVPAYSGYVKKAERAADEQLLSAINTAYAAACIENGEDMSTISGANMPLNEDKTVKLESVAPYAEDFAGYFSGNESSAFKVFNSIVYSPTLGVFVNSADAPDVALVYGDGYITLSGSDIAAVLGSTFVEAEGLGIEGLMNKVNDVSVFAAALDGSASYNKVLTDPEYMKSFLGYMGIDASGLEGRGLQLKFSSELTKLSDIKYSELTAGKGELSQEEQAAYHEQAANLVKANMAVLHAAQNTNKLREDQINNLLNSSDPKSTIIGTLNGDSGQGLSEAALYYGMYTSFAYSKEYGNSTRQDSTKNPLQLLTSLDDAEIQDFKAYVNSDQGKADLEAYISSMNMINSSTGSTDAVKNVLTNGFNDAELSKLIQQALGK